MNKKPHKAEESTAAYPAQEGSKATTPASTTENPICYIDPAKARDLTKKILNKHSDVFRRLAQ